MQNFIESQPWNLLLKASGQAAVLIVLILAAQWVLGRRLRPGWRYALWLLVVVRLALPWTVPSALSVFNLLSFSKASENVISQKLNPGALASTAEGGVRRTSEVLASADAPRWRLSLPWLPLLWGAGALALAAYIAKTHYRLWRCVTPCRVMIDSQVLSLLEDCKQQMGVRVPVTLVETAVVDGPCLFGFLRPRLLLPPGLTRDFSRDELRYVFLHELAHVRRHDIPLGWLMALLQILHWFNPLVWLAFSRMSADRELACDALALSHAGDEDNKPYGRTIVKLLESFGHSLRAPSLAGISEDKQQMKERIAMIAKFQKTNRGTALAFSLFVGLGLLTLTDCTTGKRSLPQPAADSSTTPKILSTTPKVGATDVDPALKEITVSFDRDMGGGYSWTGGGPDYPPTPEEAKVQWRDKRTCVLPVRLEAGHYYRVGINSTSYQNFRSAAGSPALPSALFFTTQGASEDLKARTRAPEVVRFDPGNRTRNVSPTITELRVTFSVPMGGGCSWCSASEDGADYPKGREGKQMSWTEDKKTCVLPVELNPGTTYRISLNAPEFKNFQSEAGVPLEPVAYSFQTSGKRTETTNSNYDHKTP
jgi:beta-lactamase regulating signal transducer with metallopeptidase domain